MVAEKVNENESLDQSELVQGTQEMLILKTLALEPMYRYGAGGLHRFRNC